MKKIIKLLAIIIFTMAITIIFQNKVEAKSYTVENMDIQATIQQDGSVEIKQTLTYKFNGSYNGIYINVPFNYDDEEFEEVVKNNKINDNLYNGTSVTVNKVAQINDSNITEYKEINEFSASNGMEGCYTSSKQSNLQKIKVYSPSTDTTKTFEIDYIINNLCVKHNDIGELYYNFIGGAWEVTIKNC
jgi:ribosomal protein S6